MLCGVTHPTPAGTFLWKESTQRFTKNLLVFGFPAERGHCPLSTPPWIPYIRGGAWPLAVTAGETSPRGYVRGSPLHTLLLTFLVKEKSVPVWAAWAHKTKTLLHTKFRSKTIPNTVIILDVVRPTCYNRKKEGLCRMSDVRTVFTTAEVAQMLELTPSYVLRLASRMDFLPEEFRSAGKRNYLFSQEAVEKLRQRPE